MTDPLPANDMADFISGFIGGLATGFDEPAAEECYKALSPDTVNDEVKAGITKLRSTFMESVDDWLLFIKQFPNTL